MVFTWFSHILYFQASFTVRSTYLVSENSATSRNDTKVLTFYTFFLSFAGPSETIANTMQIKPSEASLTLHIYRLGGL